ncbi:helix-turn-helix domain-containing protein [Nocardia salmonicida]|uniref:AlbA family DNA-binding domain-containing protein n=1 Tax=Nocardia salmonicida TaxID=53431 RepID=UPI00371ADE1A
MTQPGPQWTPRTEAELQHAIEHGLLEETHYLDLKQALDPGKSANKKFAADIAAFALDGGTIIIGVDEGDDGATPQLHPIDLNGLPERVESIARTAVHEPVQITSTRIAADNSAPGHAYLIVHVPQSPCAPHMVDGRFYGRGDKTNRILSQEEVLRLHERRLRDRSDIIAETRRFLDGLNPRGDRSSIMAILAEPVGAAEELLVPLVDAAEWQREAFALLQAATQPNQHTYSPTVADSSDFARRAGGVALTTGMHNTPPWEGGDRATELTFHENGSLTLASERTVMTRKIPVQPPRPDIEVVFEQLIIGNIDLLTRLVALVADKYGFTGSWRFGLVITGLAGTHSYSLNEKIGFGPQGTPYSAATYERATTASLLDLTNNPRAITETLVAPLLRGLGSATTWKPFLTGTDTA